jgi:hypothetical protein
VDANADAPVRVSSCAPPSYRFSFLNCSHARARESSRPAAEMWLQVVVEAAALAAVVAKAAVVAEAGVEAEALVVGRVAAAVEPAR